MGLLDIRAAVIPLFVLAVACTSSSQTPPATATPDISNMIEVALTKAAPIPTPTSTTAPTPTAEPTPTIEPTRPTSELVTPDIGDELVHFGPSIAELVEQLRPTVVQFTKGRKSVGSGVIISKGGLVLTNAHVVECCTHYTLYINGQKYQSEVVKKDAAADLATVQIKSGAPFQSAVFASHSTVGDEVLALGFPLQLGHDLTVTKGIVSAFRQMRGSRFAQHDAAINPGNSGGPLVNLNGEIVGINTSYLADAKGIGFALSVREISRQLPELTAGKVSRIRGPIQTMATRRPAPTAEPTSEPTTEKSNMTDYVPVLPKIKWTIKPTVNASGLLKVHVEMIGSRKFIHPLHPTNPDFYSNITLVDDANGKHRLIGAVMPHLPPGRYWAPRNITIIADIYEVNERKLKVYAHINPSLDNVSNLTVCAWTGGPAGINEVLGCSKVLIDR